MPAHVSVPNTTLRFVRHENHIWFMTEPVFEGLTLRPLELSLPIVQINGVHLGQDGIRVGYQIEAPRDLTLVQPNFLLVAKDKGGLWEPHIGLPGMQMYVGETGICMISTRITRYFQNVE